MEAINPTGTEVHETGVITHVVAPGCHAKRWKQWLLSTLAVLPLTATIPPALGWLARKFAPAMPAILVLVVTAAAISAGMVYCLMPLLTRWAGRWLER